MSLVKEKNALFDHLLLLVSNSAHDFRGFSACSACLIRSDSAALNNVV